MHIPPGFLQPQVWIPMTAVSAAGVGYALKKTESLVDDRRTPVMGVMAAFIFAAQMVNFPVLGGTSGHLMGGTLAAVVLGVWPGIVVMTAVLIVQAVLFQDGGLDALGANVFNMGIFSCLVTGALTGLFRRSGMRSQYVPIAIAAWCTVVGSAVLCAVQLALSGTSPIKVVLPAMTFVHAVIGVFEAFVTVLALRFISAASPGLFHGGREKRL